MSDELLGLTIPPIYYEFSKGTYWYEKDGNWNKANESHALEHLDSMGVSHAKKKKPFSLAQAVLRDIREHRTICYAGPVAGLAPGVYGDGDMKYISVGRPFLQPAVAGDWADIRVLCERLFGPEQIDYVYSWLKQATEYLYRDNKNFSQALLLAGGPGCGKSFFQCNIVTPLLGNRVARPIQYMTGVTSFNSDLIGCEHLMLEDENAKRDHPSRRALGTSIKSFTVNTQQRVHAKGKEAFTVASRHWITLSINDEEENLHVLPQLDDSIKDKMILVYCRPAINDEWPGKFAAIRKLEEKVRGGIGHFAEWLLNRYEIPEAIRDERFGVKSYYNPELIQRIDIGDRETELEEIIDRHWPELFADGKTLTISGTELYDAVTSNPDLGYRAKQLLNWTNATGIYLSRLVKKYPERYSRGPAWKRPQVWVIRPRDHRATS